MGIPTDPGDNGYEEGDPCADCWGEGKPLGDVPSPKYVVATFSGVISCEGGFAPDGSYTLTQSDVLPCYWFVALGNGFLIDWYPSIEGESRLFCTIGPEPANWSFIAHGDLCDTLFTNEIPEVSCPGVRAYGGTCQIS